MSISAFSMTENFITKFTFVFLLIHDKLVNIGKKLTTQIYMCSVLLSNLKWYHYITFIYK